MSCVWADARRVSNAFGSALSGGWTTLFPSILLSFRPPHLLAPASTLFRLPSLARPAWPSSTARASPQPGPWTQQTIQRTGLPPSPSCARSTRRCAASCATPSSRRPSQSRSADIPSARRAFGGTSIRPGRRDSSAPSAEPRECLIPVCSLSLRSRRLRLRGGRPGEWACKGVGGFCGLEGRHLESRVKGREGRADVTTSPPTDALHSAPQSRSDPEARRGELKGVIRGIRSRSGSFLSRDEAQSACAALWRQRRGQRRLHHHLVESHCRATRPSRGQVNAARRWCVALASRDRRG